MSAGEALRAKEREHENRRKASRAYSKKVASIKAELAPGSDLTFKQLAEVQPSMKADTMRRHPEWFVEAA